MNEEEKDIAERAITNHMCRTFSDWLVFAIGLAAEKYPLEIKKALEGVFDLKAVTSETKRITAVLDRTNQLAHETRNLIRDTEAKAQNLQQILDNLKKEIAQCQKIKKS